MRRAGIAVAFIAALLPVVAVAGSLETVDHNVYTGVVLALEETDAIFLWQQDKDQPEAVKRGDADKVYQSMGQEAVVQRVPLTRIDKVDGIPVEPWQAVYRGSLFYRVFAGLEGARIQAGTSGDFVKQIKGIVVFLGFLIVAIPLLLVLASLPFAGSRLSYGYGIGMTLMLAVLGFAGAFLARILAVNAGFAQTAGAQMALSVVIGLVMAGIVHFSTRFSFWQGLLFTAVWSAAFFFSPRVIMMVLGGIPDLPPLY
ncbi:MAG: hypothetical protein FJ087_14390 [Deltaproteobacteria bacterium]|nr:hypothetical protein [Deltaproteobacteria bacterium]